MTAKPSLPSTVTAENEFLVGVRPSLFLRGPVPTQRIEIVLTWAKNVSMHNLLFAGKSV